MGILIRNIVWMSINIFLAITPVIAILLVFVSKPRILKYFFLFMWLFFLPNTIYIVTDLIHIPKHLAKVNGIFEISTLMLQYIVLEFVGFAAFFTSLYLFEQVLLTAKNKIFEKYADIIIVVLNFAVGFGIVLGRIQRTNSWEVFTNTERVIRDTVNLLSSFEQILLALIFGSFGNFIYFTFKDRFAKFIPKRFLRKGVPS